MPRKNTFKLVRFALLMLVIMFSAFAFAQSYASQNGAQNGDVISQIQVAPGEGYKLPGENNPYVYVYQTSPGFTLNAKWAEIAILSEYAKLSEGSSFHGFKVHLNWEKQNDSSGTEALKEIRLDGAYESDSPEVLQITDPLSGKVYKEELYNSRAVFTPAISPPFDSQYYADSSYGCVGGPSMRTGIKLLGKWYELAGWSIPSSDPSSSNGRFITLNKESSYGIINVGDSLGDYPRIKLSDISVATGACNTHPAILDILSGPVDEPLDTTFKIAGLSDNVSEVYVTASYYEDGLPVDGASCFVEQEGNDGKPPVFSNQLTGNNPPTWKLDFANGNYEQTLVKNSSVPVGTYAFTAYCSRDGYALGAKSFAVTFGDTEYSEPDASDAINQTAPSEPTALAYSKTCDYMEPSVKILEARRTGTSALEYTVRIRGASTGDDCAAKQYQLQLDAPSGWIANLEGSSDVSVAGTNEVFRQVTVAPPFPDKPTQGEYTFNANLYSEQAGRRVASDAGAYVYNEIPEITAPTDALYDKEVNGMPVSLIAYSPSSGNDGTIDASLLRTIVSGQPEEGKNISSGNYSLELLSLSPPETRDSRYAQNKIALRLYRNGFPTNRIDANDGDVIPIEYSDGKVVFVSIMASSLGTNGGSRYAEVSLFEQEAKSTLTLGEKIYGANYSLEYEGTKETDGRPTALFAVYKNSEKQPRAGEADTASLPAAASGSGANIIDWLLNMLFGN